MVGMGEADLWAGELESVSACVAGRFSQVDLRWRMGDYVRGLPAPVKRKNGWKRSGTRTWPDRATARAEVFTFIETFYNRRRLRKHKIIGYLTLAETRQRHQHTLAA